MKRKTIVAFAAAALLSMFSGLAQAAVSRVVVVETSDMKAYVQEIEKGKALLQRAGSPAQIRVWRARFAGPNAGNVVVTVEYSDMVTFANDDKKMAADAEYQAWLKGLDRVRKIVSDSLYEEARP